MLSLINIITRNASPYNTFELLLEKMKNKIKLAAVTPLSKPVRPAVNVPGSKSYSLRVLMISALCDDKFEISNLLASDDVFAMQDCLTALSSKQIAIEARESGLSARFMIALACISYGVQIISGRPGLKKRPVKDLVDALQVLGAQIEYMEKDGFLPVKVLSSKLIGNKVALKGDTSSHYLSSLLLIAPGLQEGVSIESRESKSPSLI